MCIVSPVFQNHRELKLQDAWNLNANRTHGYADILKT